MQSCIGSVCTHRKVWKCVWGRRKNLRKAQMWQYSTNLHNTMQHTFKTEQPFKVYARLAHMFTHLFLILEERNSVSVCPCVVTEITGDVMEHGEPQPHWLYSSETKIALLWLTAHIHASNSKYQPVDHFYKLYSIHIRDNGQSGTLWLPNITYSASMSRNPRNTVWLFWIKSPFYVWCMQLFHKV